ncbi:2Fe-2S iron-sulfur cluster-binding protein [Campylobacterota bacterium]
MVSVLLQDDNIKVKVPSGTTMREVALKSGASMEFGCRVGDCTTCAVHVISGACLLSDKQEKEIKALEMIGGNLSEIRLMCQCSIKCEEGEIVISYGL